MDKKVLLLILITVAVKFLTIPLTRTPDEMLYFNAISNNTWKVHTPLYGFIGMFIFRLFGPNFLYLQLVTLLFSLAGLIFLYKLLILFYSKQISLLSTILFSINPFFWSMSERALLDVPMISLLFISFYFFFAYLKNDRSSYLAFSIFSFCFSFLVKEFAIISIPIFFIAPFLLRRKQFSGFVYLLTLSCLFFLFLLFSAENFVYTLNVIMRWGSFQFQNYFNINYPFNYLHAFFYSWLPPLYFFYYGIGLLFVAFLNYAFKMDRNWVVLIIALSLFILSFDLDIGRGPRCLLGAYPFFIAITINELFNNKSRLFLSLGILFIFLPTLLITGVNFFTNVNLIISVLILLTSMNKCMFKNFQLFLLISFTFFHSLIFNLYYNGILF